MYSWVLEKILHFAHLLESGLAAGCVSLDIQFYCLYYPEELVAVSVRGAIKEAESVGICIKAFVASFWFA